ncbi:MAG: hypothetical protein WEC75_00550 [Dehalococcoidia bacterium]
MSTLSIYVSAGPCVACSRARDLGHVLAESYPDIEVRLIDIGSLAPGDVPDAVVAVPTYLLDGAVLSLGNPHEATLREKLAALALANG